MHQPLWRSGVEAGRRVGFARCITALAKDEVLRIISSGILEALRNVTGKRSPTTDTKASVRPEAPSSTIAGSSLRGR